MEFLEEEQNVIRRYLLGDLDEKQCQRLEERIFTSPTFKAQVRIAEDELAEDYLAERLSAGDREAFRRRLLLTSEQKQRVEIISALMTFAAQQPPVSIDAVTKDTHAPRRRTAGPLSFLAGRRPKIMFATASIAIIVAVAAFWLIPYSSETRLSPEELARRQEIERELNRLNPPGGQPLPPELTAPVALIPSVTLQPNTSFRSFRSGGEMARLEIPDGARIAQLRLELSSGGYNSYQIALCTIEEIEILKHAPLTPGAVNDSKDLIFNLPTSVLPSGDYRLKLTGRHDAGQFGSVVEYYVRVIRRKSL